MASTNGQYSRNGICDMTNKVLQLPSGPVPYPLYLSQEDQFWYIEYNGEFKMKNQDISTVNIRMKGLSNLGLGLNVDSDKDKLLFYASVLSAKS